MLRNSPLLKEGLAPGRDFEFEVNLTRAMTTGMMLDYNNALARDSAFDSAGMPASQFASSIS